MLPTSSTGLITCATILSTTSQADANRSNAYNAVENIAADVQNAPALLTYINWGNEGTIYFDGNFEIVSSSEDSAANVNYNSTVEEVGNNEKYYTVNLRNFKLNGADKNLLEDITITSIA